MRRARGLLAAYQAYLRTLTTHGVSR
jgi:hypothetical protein